MNKKLIILLIIVSVCSVACSNNCQDLGSDAVATDKKSAFSCHESASNVIEGTKAKCNCPCCNDEKSIKECTCQNCDKCSKCEKCSKCASCPKCNKGKVDMENKDSGSCGCKKELKTALNVDESLKERFKDVKDFDSCVAAGGMVLKTNPPKCKNPLTGEIYTRK